MPVLPFSHHDTPYTLAPSKIIGVGLNYREHISEQHMQSVRGFDAGIPTEPVIFSKTPNVLIGHGDPIPLARAPGDAEDARPRIDYEAELAFVVKDDCRNVPVEKALDHILGYTCMNDVSRRDIQKGDVSGWFRGKSFDGFGPVGPVLVPAEEIPDPQDLEIRCRLNGKVVQEAHTGQMIFTVAELLSYLSHNFTMKAGDLVATGTPSGVGPLTGDDVVEVEIEGIGVLRNPVIQT